MSTPEGDELLRMIRRLVEERGVHPTQRDVVTELVARTVVTVMTEPRFYTNLAIVQNLQARVTQLEFAIAQYAKQSQRGSPAARPPKPMTSRKQAAKKLPVKKISKKPPLPYNVRAFKKGAAGQ